MRNPFNGKTYMRRTFVCAAASLCAGLIVSAAVSSDEGVVGHCKEKINDCVWECPECHVHYIAEGHHGPSYSMTGICQNCHKEVTMTGPSDTRNPSIEP